MKPTPTLLLILDGWGLAPDGPGNAVSLARTPTLDSLLRRYPWTTLACSGRAVGLPDGFMGNSEVGHMNIGAGRVMYQDMTRIDMAIEDGSLYGNNVLLELLTQVKTAGGRLHFMGLLSDGGVHSHVNHLHALLRMAKDHDVPAVVHAFLDGRDTPPTSGKGYLQDLERYLKDLGHGCIATVMGRYYAMDRDKRWERNALAYHAMTMGRGEFAPSATAAVQQGYDAGENDEFVKPRVVTDAAGVPLALLRDRDGIFFFNFRADRARQICTSLFKQDFDSFPRQVLRSLSGFATMTCYESTFPMPVAFPPISTANTLGEIVSGMGLRQLRIAETEKYAHVTYFLNCGREEPFPGEERVMVPSPREVATYDLKPEMSAEEVTGKFMEHWKGGRFSLAVCNLANLDMVGHTGIIPAAIEACETVDLCVARLVETVLADGGRVLLTADHGNAEEMLDAHGNPQTAHSLNPVRLALIAADFEGLPRQVLRQDGGKLGDIAPTILDLWGQPKPRDMSGESLLLDTEAVKRHAG